MRGERAWVQDILEGWEDETENGHPRLTPFLGRRSTPVPVPKPEPLLSMRGKCCGKSHEESNI
jgi:hypothetical protein